MNYVFLFLFFPPFLQERMWRRFRYVLRCLCMFCVFMYVLRVYVCFACLCISVSKRACICLLYAVFVQFHCLLACVCT